MGPRGPPGPPVRTKWVALLSPHLKPFPPLARKMLGNPTICAMGYTVQGAACFYSLNQNRLEKTAVLN